MISIDDTLISMQIESGDNYNLERFKFLFGFEANSCKDIVQYFAKKLKENKNKVKLEKFNKD